MSDDAVTPAMRDFLTALNAALDVPDPASREDMDKAQLLREKRVNASRVVIGMLIDGSATLGPAARVMGRQIDVDPVTYEPRERSRDET